MKKYLSIAGFLLIPFLAIAQTKNPAALTDAASLLFKNTKSKLTNDEKNWLCKQMNIKLSKDKKVFMSDEYEIGAEAYITDLNKDGIEEVFVVIHSVALFGNAGESFSMFIKNKTGNFELQPDLGGGSAMIVTSQKTGYPDIAIGGPGYEFPSYRWEGNKYKPSKKIKDADLQSGKIKVMDLAECAKTYSATLK
jgi:hypothetical protein